MPQLVAAVSLAAASRRIGRAGLPAACAVLAVAMAAGALQINEYYRFAWRNGGAQNWTDAIYPLEKYAASLKGSEIYCADWGILDSLRLLDRGRLPLHEIFGAIPADQGSGDMPRILAALADAHHVFLAHTKAFEFIEGGNEKLRIVAATAGYRRETLARIADSFGRPTFEAYRFTRAAESR